MSFAKSKTVFCLLLAVLFCVMLVLNVLTPMAADDYRYAFSFATGERLSSVADIFPSLAAHMTVMNGRMTPHFLLHLFTMLPHAVFDVFNSLMFVMLVWGMHRLAAGRGKHDAALLLAITGAVFVLVPGFGPSFLWLAGSCNYLWCDALLVWLLVPFADNILQRPEETSKAMQIWMLPAALFFGNMSQNVSAAGVMVMVLCILWLWKKRRSVCWWMIGTAVCAFAGWAFCITSPGDTGMLEAGLSGMGPLLQHFQAAAEKMLQNGLIPGCVLLALTAFKWFEDEAKDRTAFIIILFAAALASNYAMAVSTYYPSRAFTGTALMLILAIALALPEWNGRKIKAALAACLVFFTAVSLLHALPDLYACHAMHAEREAQACAAAQNGEKEWTTFCIASRSKYDAFLEIHELTYDPDQYNNVYFAKYHGLETVTAERVE